MPAPDQDIIITPQTADMQVSLEPASNALHSLLLLIKSDYYSGLGDWVGQTLAAMTPAELDTHRLVMLGLHYAVFPERSWPNFPAYLDHLAQMDPFVLRDKMLNAYLHMPICEPTDEQPVIETAVAQTILESPESYLAFLRGRFGAELVDDTLERQAYAYAINPTAMQIMIVSHLRKMWEQHLRQEWNRVQPMLQQSAGAFQQENLTQMSRLEAAEFVTGQNLSEQHWQKMFETADQLLFVPSAHVGPYLGRIKRGNKFIIIFGARLPEGIHTDAPDLSRAEIVVRLSALADDTRIRILEHIGNLGELRSQDIMQQLELSQSAASRHLKQLSANGFLTERRCEGAKCYEMNPDRIHKTLQGISVYLTKH